MEKSNISSIVMVGIVVHYIVDNQHEFSGFFLLWLNIIFDRCVFWLNIE